MSKGQKMQSQTQPPTGIKRKAWLGKQSRSEKTSKHRPGSFTISCAEPGCFWKQDPTGAPDRDHAVRCGIPAPKTCPAGHTFPVGGYIK